MVYYKACWFGLKVQLLKGLWPEKIHTEELKFEDGDSSVSLSLAWKGEASQESSFISVNL